MRTRWLLVLANGLAAAVLALLLIDPTRPLLPVFVLLAVAVVTLYAWHFRRPRR